jgi:hypothetical protein
MQPALPAYLPGNGGLLLAVGQVDSNTTLAQAETLDISPRRQRSPDLAELHAFQLIGKPQQKGLRYRIPKRL